MKGVSVKALGEVKFGEELVWETAFENVLNAWDGINMAPDGFIKGAEIRDPSCFPSLFWDNETARDPGAALSGFKDTL